MRIECTQAGRAIVLTPHDSRIDAHNAAEFRTSMVERIDAGARDVTIDLHRVDFMDSSGFGALVVALKRIGTDGTLRVRALKPAVQTLFDLTGLSRIIPVLESEHDGMRTVPD